MIHLGGGSPMQWHAVLSLSQGLARKLLVSRTNVVKEYLDAKSGKRAQHVKIQRPGISLILAATCNMPSHREAQR